MVEDIGDYIMNRIKLYTKVVSMCIGRETKLTIMEICNLSYEFNMEIPDVVTIIEKAEKIAEGLYDKMMIQIKKENKINKHMEELNAENMRKIASRIEPLFSKELIETEIRESADNKEFSKTLSVVSAMAISEISKWLTPLGFKVGCDLNQTDLNVIITW